ncbi:MAG: AraC family transcriptional regulator [Saccharofermentanales bacterium]
MIIDGYREISEASIINSDLNIVSYPDSDLNIFFMWHPPVYPSILPHWHDRVEFLYIVEGTLNISCGNFAGTATQGDVFISNPNQLHAANSGQSGVKYYAFLLGERFLKEMGSPVSNSKFVDPLLLKKIQFCNYVRDDRINTLLDKIIKEHTDKEYAYEIAIQSSFLAIFSLLSRHYIDSSQKFSELDNKFTKVIQYISENYINNITTDSITKEFSYNKSHFCKKFKQQTGMTVTTYITFLRLELASSLIKSTNRSITEISSETGFNDSNYFSRKFFQYYNIHPTDVRKQIRSV